MSSLSDLILPHVAALEPYTPILPFEVVSQKLGRRPEEIVKLDANENPYGVHPAVRRALADHPFLHIYPDPEQRELRAALAGYTGAPAERILASHGADELLDLLCRMLVGPGDGVIDCPPTFGMYSFDTSLAAGQVLNVTRGPDFRVEVAGIEAACAQAAAAGIQPKLLFLTSPNNPDGGLLDPDDLKRVLDLPLLVVVDEAYVEFAGLECSYVPWIDRYENLVILRTFSKWAGLAGLRLGYGVFPAWLMPTLWKAKQPYNVSVAAAAAGLAALAHRDEITVTVEALIRERERLIVELGRVPYLHPHRSHANFVLCDVRGQSASALQTRLAQQGVLVRRYAKPGLENCIRVSAGRPADTDALLTALTN